MAVKFVCLALCPEYNAQLSRTCVPLLLPVVRVSQSKNSERRNNQYRPLLHSAIGIVSGLLRPPAIDYEGLAVLRRAAARACIASRISTTAPAASAGAGKE